MKFYHFKLALVFLLAWYHLLTSLPSHYKYKVNYVLSICIFCSDWLLAYCYYTSIMVPKAAISHVHFFQCGFVF